MSATFLVDLEAALVGDASIRPTAALTADTNGTGIDLSLTDGPVHAIVIAGVTDFASLDEVYAIRLEESDTSGGTYTAISGATAAITATATCALISTGFRSKRWVRAVLDVSGTTPSIFLTVYVCGRRKIAGSGAGTVT
jgi:hypothetical protein